LRGHPETQERSAGGGQAPEPPCRATCHE
jgi:hypothetical protein